MTKKIPLFIALLLVSALCAEAQTAMGKWRTHFSYNNVTQVTQSPNKLFAVSDGALFSADKRDGNVELYSKISGLNGAMVSRVKYDDTTQKLLVIYNNGNMDFISENGIKNLPDFYNKLMSADKAVNHILFYNGKAFLSCNFGVMALNMNRQEIQETYYIGANATDEKVLSTAVAADRIYAATATDIYTALLSDPFLVSYEHWSKLTELPGSGNIQSLITFGDYLILLRNGKLYQKKTATAWTPLDDATTYTSVSVSGDHLHAFTANTAYIYNQLFEKKIITDFSGIVSDATLDKDGDVLWLAANTQGLVKYSLSAQAVVGITKPDGPASNRPYKLAFMGKKMFALQGGRIEIYKQDARPGMVMILENNVWKNILQNEIVTGRPALDFMDIAIDPDDDKHFLISSYGTGVFEFKDDKFFKNYDFTNSTIETIFPGNPTSGYIYMRMDGGVYDDQKNVWFTNTWSNKVIKVLKNDGNWLSLGTPNLSKIPTAGALLINRKNKNHKWVLSVREDSGISCGIIIFDDNGTLENTSDDKSVFLTTFLDTDNGGGLSMKYAYCAVQDKNDVIWIGTDKGPLLFKNPEKAFDTDFAPTRIKIPRNDGTNLADYLLENDAVKAIAIDGANRKWLGTERSGVYLVSEDGQKTIKHFTAENSSLLSNNIMSIDLNSVTGEVFFGTTNGLVSYQSDAAQGGEMFGNVHVYPNPVRENFTGIITITGLVDKTNVKITDLAGNLVCQTMSNGSIATWDGKNGHGKKVSTGVYLALCISPDGEQSTTTKILIIN